MSLSSCASQMLICPQITGDGVKDVDFAFVGLEPWLRLCISDKNPGDCAFLTSPKLVVMA